MPSRAAPTDTVLLVRAGGRLCALPISSVVETMRPLPVEPLAGAPALVRGVAVVRGEPVPVVDLAAVVGGAPERGAIGRFVTVRAGAREIPLVRDACAGALEALRARDGDLLVVLGAARLVPDEAVAALARREAAP